jgi:glycosyltransferase involved in cell wall biosynthesis
MVDPSSFTPPYDHHLCEALAETGWEVKLFTSGKTDWKPNTYRRVRGFYPLTESRMGTTLPDTIRLLAKGGEHFVGMMQLAARLRRWDPDIIHFQWLPLPFVDIPFVRLMKHIAPTVLTVHDSTAFQAAATSRIQRIMAQRGPRAVDKVIVHTDQTKDEVVSTGVSPTDISIIPHGVIRYPELDEITSDRSDEITVLFFGNIKPYKGVDVLINAVACLPSDVKRELRVVVAGRPHGHANELKELARKRGVTDLIKWDLGFVEHEDVSGYFQQSDIVVFPYRHIDQSGALMTALPFGKPILATNVGGFADVLTDGVHGGLVPPDDANALSTALAELLESNERRDKMGTAVAELADDTYSWRRISDMTTDLYHYLLQEQRS